jgi:Flp pilus assembly protein TadG
MRQRRRLVQYTAAEGGTAAMEFAIWLLVLVPVFVNAIDLGRYVYEKMQVSNVAQTAAQAAWLHCATPPTSNCATFDSDLSTAITYASHLSSAVQEDTGQREEGYYCADTATGALVSNAAQTPPTTCPSGAKAGYYFKLQVHYTYHPLFSRVSASSLLANPIVQTAWTRLQ